MSSQPRLPLPPPLPHWRRKKKKTSTKTALDKKSFYESTSLRTSPSFRANVRTNASDGTTPQLARRHTEGVANMHRSPPLTRNSTSPSRPTEVRSTAEKAGQPALWALNVAPPRAHVVVQDDASPLAGLARRSPKSRRPLSATDASPPSPVNNIRLAPLALGQVHAENPSAGSTSLLQRATPRNMRSLIRNFLLDSSGALNPHIDMVAHAIDSGVAITNSLLQEVLQFHPNVESLNLQACSEITDVGLWAIARFCEGLTGLNLSRAEGFTHIGLRSLTLRCENITNLDLSYCPQINDTALRVVAGGCGRLQHLNVSYCDKITDMSLSEIAQCCRDLLTLDISFCKGVSQFGDYALKLLGANVHGLQELKALGCPYIRNEGIEGLAEGPCSSTLHSLRLTACTAGLKGNIPIDALTKFSQLKHLQLAGWKRVTDTDLRKFCERLPQLRILDISGSQFVSATGLKSLAKLPLLIDLNLQNCTHVGDPKSLESICQACPLLEALNIAGCRGYVRQTAINALTAGCSRLAVLNVTETREMNLRYIQDLAARLPFSVPHVENSSKLKRRRQKRSGRPHSRVGAYQGDGLLGNLKALEADLKDAEAQASLSQTQEEHLVNSNWLDPEFFGLQAVENYYQCVREEEFRIKGEFAAIRIQSFLRGAAARGGVAALREKYKQIKATGKFQAAFRGMRGRRRAREVLALVQRINLSTTLSRLWRGSVVRREVARQRRYLELCKNRKLAATRCQALIRGHLARCYMNQILRDKAIAEQQASIRRHRRDRAAVVIQSMFRAFKSRGVYWAAVSAHRQEQMLQKLRVATAIRVQNLVRTKIAKKALSHLREQAAHRRFVHALTLLQARVKAWKARAMVNILREEQQWYEYQWYCAQVIQRCWRRARSRFTVQILRSLAALSREEDAAARVLQRFSRLVKCRSVYWAAKKAREEAKAQNRAQQLIKRVWYGSKGRSTAEVFRALLKARKTAAPIYEALEEIEAQRREVKQKLDVVLKKHGSLMKIRNAVATELRQVLKTRQKYYDSATMQPGVSQRFLVSFLREELKERLRDAKENIKPLTPVIDTLDKELADLDEQIRVLRVKLRPYEDDIKAKALRHRRDRIRKTVESQARAATLLQAAFRGQRLREALRRSGGVNYWIIMWDEEEERDIFYNTFSGEKSTYKPPEMSLFEVEPKTPHKSTKWVEEWDTTAGAYFYYNTRTGEYRWEKPPDFDINLGEGVQGEGLEWFEVKKSESSRQLSIENEESEGGNGEVSVDGENSEDYLSQQPKTGRSIYAWEELIDEETERTYYLNSETGETRWSLPPREALSGETAVRITQALVAENPLWHGVEGEKIDVPDRGERFQPVTLEDSVVFVPNDDDAADSSPPEQRSQTSEQPQSQSLVASGNDRAQDPVQSAHDPLPEDWEEVEDDDSGTTFFYNAATGESRWDRPKMRQLLQTAQAGAAFLALKDAPDQIATTTHHELDASAGGTDKETSSVDPSLAITDPVASGSDDVEQSPKQPSDAEEVENRINNEVDSTDEFSSASSVADRVSDGVLPVDVLPVEEAQADTSLTSSAPEPVDNSSNHHLSKEEDVEDHPNIEAQSTQVLNNDPAAADGLTGDDVIPIGQEQVNSSDTPEHVESTDNLDRDLGASSVQVEEEHEGQQQSGSDGPQHSWEEVVDEESGQTYYYNQETGESLWEIPPEVLAAVNASSDASVASTSAKEPVWEELVNGDGAKYYYNNATGETTSDRPVELDEHTSGADSSAGDPSTEDKTDAESHDDLAAASDAVENWEKVLDEDGDSYFYNHVTGESRRDLPRHMLLGMSALNAIHGLGQTIEPSAANNDAEVGSTSEGSPEDWELVTEDDGTTYFYNTRTGETTYDNPHN